MSAVISDSTYSTEYLGEFHVHPPSVPDPLAAGSSLVALGTVVPQFVAPDRDAAAAGQGQHPRRRRTHRRQRRPQHRHPLRRRPLPQGPADAPADEGPGHPPRRPRRAPPGHAGLQPMWDAGHLAVVQGVGYPNPDRSHFEAMDIWHSADPKRQTHDRLARPDHGRDGQPRRAECRSCTSGPGKSPLAVAGAPGGGAVSVGDQQLVPPRPRATRSEPAAARRKLLEDLSAPPARTADDDLLSFVQRRQVQTLTAVETPARAARRARTRARGFGDGLSQKLQLVAGLIAQRLRHPHLLRQPRRLRHARRPGPRPPAAAGRTGRRDRRFLPRTQGDRRRRRACG